MVGSGHVAGTREIPWARLLIVFGIALTLRVGVTWKFQGLDAPPKAEANPDQVEYERLAYQLSVGNGYVYDVGKPTAYRPPGTSFTLLPVYWTVGRSFRVARIWFCLISSLTCIATWWCASQAFGQRTGLFAAFLLAIYPGHFYYAMHFLSEVPIGLFVILACAFGLAARRRSPGWADFLCGTAWGAASLVRPNMLLGGLLTGLAQLRTSAAWRAGLAKALLVAAGAAAVVTPWMVRNARLVGAPTISTIGGFVFWGANNAVVANDAQLLGYWAPVRQVTSVTHPLDGDERHNEAAAWANGWDFVTGHWALMPRLVLHRVLRLVWAYTETSNTMVDWSFKIGWLALAPFVVGGCALALRRHAADGAILLVPIVVTLLTGIVFYGCNRFRDQIAPDLVIFAAYCLTEISGLRHRQRYKTQHPTS